MFNKSISFRLSIFVSLAVISVFLAFIVITYFFNQKLLSENIKTRAIGISTGINSRVSQYVVSTREIADNLSKQVLYYSERGDTKDLLSMVMSKYDFLYAVHVNFNEELPFDYRNYFMVRTPDSLHFERSDEKIFDCIDEAEVLEKVAVRKKSGWTEPYRCNEFSNNIVVSYYCPVYEVSEGNDTTFLGELVCELSLLEMNAHINEIELGNEGFAFIIDTAGRYITHPRQDWIMNRSIFDLSNKVFDLSKIDFSNIVGNKISGDAVARPELLDYQKSWVYYTPIESKDWYLIFVLSYDELFSDLYLITLRLLFFAVAGIVIIYFIITYITNKLIEPLSEATDELKEFSRKTGNLSQDTLDEINRVTESLKSLKSWYEKQEVEQKRARKKSDLQKQDLLQASEIQQSIIKTDFPVFPERDEIDIYAIYKPAREVSGDLFDFFFIDDENLVFTIGDVSGKGVPAAIFMSIAQTIIKSNALYKKSKNIVNKANKELCTDNQHQFFLTLFLGVLKIKKKELYYCNAAHTTGFVLKTTGDLTELSETHGLPLGLYPEKGYTDSKVPLETNDTIILYTDGVTELHNNENKLFGVKQLKSVLKNCAGKEPREMAEEIEKAIDKFRDGAAQYDDISLLIVKFKA